MLVLLYDHLHSITVGTIITTNVFNNYTSTLHTGLIIPENAFTHTHRYRQTQCIYCGLESWLAVFNTYVNVTRKDRCSTLD